MKIKQFIQIYCCIILCSFSLSAQDNAESFEDVLRTLIKEEMAKAEKVKDVNGNATIEIIEDVQAIEAIRKDIAQKEKKKELEKLERRKKLSISEKYKLGETNLKGDIIKILKGKKASKRAQIYHGLKSYSFDEVPFKLEDPDIIKAIYDNILINEDQDNIIQLAGYNKLPNYIEQFEQLLLSGKAQNEHRLLYWLATEGTSTIAMDYVEKQLLDPKTGDDKKSLLMSSLSDFARKGNEENKKRTIELTIQLAEELLLEEPQPRAIRTYFYNPAISFIGILLDTNDPRVLPFFKSLEGKDVGPFSSEVMGKLIEFEGVTYKDKVMEMIEEDWSDAVGPALAMYKITKDKNIPKQILKAYAKQEDHPSYRIDWLIETLWEIDSCAICTEFDKHLKDKELIEDLQNANYIVTGSEEQLIQDLQNFGIIDAPISKPEVNEEDEWYSGPSSYVYEFLESTNILLWFDAETGMFPNDYDVLLQDFVNCARGKIKTDKIWMDVIADKDYENVQYFLTLLANGKAYKVEAVDYGDWYDLEAVFSLMNKVAEEANLIERFVMFDTGGQDVMVVFGPEKGIAEFAQKYGF